MGAILGTADVGMDDVGNIVGVTLGNAVDDNDNFLIRLLLESAK